MLIFVIHKQIEIRDIYWFTVRKIAFIYSFTAREYLNVI